MGENGPVKRLLAALCLVPLVLTGCNDAKATPQAKLSFHGVEPDPRPARPSFTLTDTSGQPYDFAERTKGRPTYVYYGYTNCPDECPTAMADVMSALRKSSRADAAKAVVVFVTTDPKRDTAAVMRRFLDQFGTEIVGLIGTQAEVDAAQRAAGVQVAAPGPVQPTLPGQPDKHADDPGNHKHFGPLGYSVSHSAVIFAYDASDRLPVLYPGGVTPTDIADDLPLLLDPSRAK
jgi:protein SCO1/2